MAETAFVQEVFVRSAWHDRKVYDTTGSAYALSIRISQHEVGEREGNGEHPLACIDRNGPGRSLSP